MTNCFLMLSRLKIHFILFLDRLKDMVRSTGNLSSKSNFMSSDMYMFCRFLYMVTLQNMGDSSNRGNFQ